MRRASSLFAILSLWNASNTDCALQGTADLQVDVAGMATRRTRILLEESAEIDPDRSSRQLQTLAIQSLWASCAGDVFWANTKSSLRTVYLVA
jgi:hypothetical protein